MQNAEYWKTRAVEMEAANHQHAEEIAAELSKQYDQIMKALDDRLRSWYTKYADENGVSYVEAQKALDAGELKDFKMTLEEYIQHGENLGVDDSWLKAMKNASARHHVTRLEAIRTDFIQKANELGVHQHNAVKSAARDAYTYTRDQEGYTVMRGTGYAVSFERVDKKRLETILKKPWAPDGKNFSDRIWENKNKLISELTTTLSQGCVTGASLDKMSRQLAKRLNVSRSNAERLIATESAYFAAEGDRQAYKDLDVEWYEFLSTLDDRTTPICKQMDGKRFPITKFESGVTAPPMHPRCRSTTIPYYPDDEKEDFETRMARDLKTGKSVRVPANISYAEWEKRFVRGKETGVQPTKPVKPAIIKEQEKKLDIKKLKLSSAGKKIYDLLAKRKVEYRVPEYYTEQPDIEQIVDVLSGGDDTEGSCASLGLAYVGQKSGLKVLDFRDGESRYFFSTGLNLISISELPDVRTIIGTARSDLTAAKNAIKQAEVGHEYYLFAGRHAAIVRKLENGTNAKGRVQYKYQYLELQAPDRENNGWRDFDEKLGWTFRARFRCSSKSRRLLSGYSPDAEARMIDVDSLMKSDDFKALLGYINTAEDKQRKSSYGRKR